MSERDLNEEASRQVNEVTGSPPVDGEELIEDEELKRLFREAKRREAGLGTSHPPGRP